MNENLIKKIFPLDKLLKNEYIKKLKYDNEGLWSISYPESAEKLSKRIKNFDSEDFKIRNILDATAGIGGNTISFSYFFDCVFAVELDKLRFNYLENNVGLFVNSNKIKLYNQNSLDFINNFEKSESSVKPDVVFFDPPWGGPHYKYEKTIDIKLSGKTFFDIVKDIYLKKFIKLVVIKFPFNYDFLNLINACKKNSYIIDFSIIKEKNVVFIFLKMN